MSPEASFSEKLLLTVMRIHFTGQSCEKKECIPGTSLGDLGMLLPTSSKKRSNKPDWLDRERRRGKNCYLFFGKQLKQH